MFRTGRDSFSPLNFTKSSKTVVISFSPAAFCSVLPRFRRVPPTPQSLLPWQINRILIIIGILRLFRLFLFHFYVSIQSDRFISSASRCRPFQSCMYRLLISRITWAVLFSTVPSRKGFSRLPVSSSSKYPFVPPARHSRR